MPSDFDRRMMTRCIELAASAREAGATPVGCVITIDGAVVAEAKERSPAGDDPFAHAEVLAVTAARQRLEKRALTEATLYTTNEPCFLCSFAIRESQIARVVFAVETPEIGGATSAYPLLHADDVNRWGRPPEVEGGLLAGTYRQMRTDG